MHELKMKRITMISIEKLLYIHLSLAKSMANVAHKKENSLITIIVIVEIVFTLCLRAMLMFGGFKRNLNNDKVYPSAVFPQYM